MKKRQFKKIETKIEKRKRELLHHILDIVLDINGLEVRTQEKTGDKPTAFMAVSGHVAGVRAEICPNGWCREEHSSYTQECYFDNSVARLSQMLVRLKKIQEEL